MRVERTYVFEEDCAFVAGPVFVAERGDEAEGADFEKGLGFLVGVDFDVLVVHVFELEGQPDALDEGAVGSESKDGDEEEGSDAYQKQLPKSLSSWSLLWRFTVPRAVPVAFLWYVFCSRGLVSVGLARNGFQLEIYRVINIFVCFRYIVLE